jgi:hypothetical protein
MPFRCIFHLSLPDSSIFRKIIRKAAIIVISSVHNPGPFTASESFFSVMCLNLRALCSSVDNVVEDISVPRPEKDSLEFAMWRAEIEIIEHSNSGLSKAAPITRLRGFSTLSYIINSLQTHLLSETCVKTLSVLGTQL